MRSILCMYCNNEEVQCILSLISLRILQSSYPLKIINAPTCINLQVESPPQLARSPRFSRTSPSILVGHY